MNGFQAVIACIICKFTRHFASSGGNRKGGRKRATKRKFLIRSRVYFHLVFTLIPFVNIIHAFRMKQKGKMKASHSEKIPHQIMCVYFHVIVNLISLEHCDFMYPGGSRKGGWKPAKKRNFPIGSRVYMRCRATFTLISFVHCDSMYPGESRKAGWKPVTKKRVFIRSCVYVCFHTLILLMNWHPMFRRKQKGTMKVNRKENIPRRIMCVLMLSPPWFHT